MAKLRWSPQEFISSSFSPMIAVASTSTVEQICRRNSLTFIELLAPFCKLNVEAQLKEPGGGTSHVKNLRVQLIDINSRPPQPILARKFLNQSVSVQSENVRTTQYVFDNDKVDVPTHIPWFERWRDTFLQVQFPSDHEFTRHYLACMFVISSSEQNPLDSLNVLMQHLNTLQSSPNAKVPKWFSSNILKYFVLVHDTTEGNNEIANQTFESLKQSYGANNCYFLPINSRPPDDKASHLHLPDPWAQFLTRRGKDRSNSSSARSSPKTPTEESFGSMPSSVSSHGGNTPVMNRSIGKLEIGQEANETSTTGVQYHPLSPENENRTVEEDAVPPLNTNVWRGSPSVSSVQGIHGICLSMNDIESLKVLIHDFILRGLIPFVEKQIQTISDQISNKKGVSRSLFSATKRWFTPSKPGTSGSTTAFNSVIYSNDSTEIQFRRLGDLYFMFGNYSMAFQAYHTVKRDFMADQAWLYYSGALEMAGLSSFMCGELNRKSLEYMEESITTYLNVCKMPQFATRTTLFSAECLKEKKMYGEAANQYIRMTSEESDLRSALLLEQAAYCFLTCTKPKLLRKYAFHIVLAGHRYSKCSQKKHSLRCYRQAYQVYKGKNWSLAEDHIQFTIGRLASSLQLVEEATESYASLIAATSRQSAQQQALFLKEYLMAHQNLTKARSALPEEPTSLPILLIPVLESDEIKILLGPQQPLRTPGRVPASGITFMSNFSDPIHQKWCKLEEMMAQIFTSNAPMIFQPQVTFFTSRDIPTSKPIAVIGEPIQVAVSLRNNLKIQLPIKNLYLLWTFKCKDSDEVYSNETTPTDITDRFIRTHVLNFANVPPVNLEEVILSVTPLAVGEVTIEGIGYDLVNTVPADAVGQYYVSGKQLFKIKGKRLRLKEKERQQQPFQEGKLEITIAPSAPCLQVAFTEITQELLANEIQHIVVEVRNCGSTALCHIVMGSTVPHLFSLTNPLSSPSQVDFSSKTDWKSGMIKVILPPQFNDRLEPGQSHVINLWLRAPETKGTTSMDLVFYYENTDTNSIPRYRLVRHQWHLSIQESLELDIVIQPSYGKNTVETAAICLTAQNTNQLHHAVISQIYIDQTSLISDKWNLIKSAGELQGREVKLLSQEKVHLLLRAERFISDSLNCTRIEHQHPNKTAITKEFQTACQDFAKRAYYTDQPALNQSGDNNEPETTPEALLLLGWHATITDSAGSKRNVMGQQHFPIKNFSTAPSNKENGFTKPITEKPYRSVPTMTIPKISPQENIVSSVRQVTYNIIHDTLLRHNFRTGPICICSIHLIINSTVSHDITVKINTIGTNNDIPVQNIKHDYSNPQSLNNFRFIGHSSIVVQLPTYKSVKVPMKCAFTTPGTFDVGARLELLCREGDNTYITVDRDNLIYDSSIIIENCDDL